MNRELVQTDEQIVRPLPRDKRVMTKIQHASVRIHLVFQRASECSGSFSTYFEKRQRNSLGARFPEANQLPVLPLPPL
jgi:hypothetical protein